MSLRRSAYAWLLLPFLSVAGAGGQTPAARALVELAPKIKFLCSDVFSDDWDARFPRVSPEFLPWRERLADPIFTTHDLLPLLRNADPKVRTLAIVTLALRDDLQALPALASLADDDASSYPCPALVANIPVSVSDVPMTAQTVGHIATSMVGFYLEAAGYYYGIHGVSDYPGFDAYWATHGNRPYSASWFAVRLLRARGEHAAERRQAVLADVAKLPEPDREWTLLWLAASEANFYGRSPLVSESELVRACREIGRSALLQMLAGHLPAQDPDLQPRRNNNGPYRRMVEAVLRHSEELLDRGDSAELLRDESAQRAVSTNDPVITGWWAIAAARLDREHAATILHGALPRFSDMAWGTDRARIVAALWELGSTSENGFVLDWFYREPLAGCCVTPRQMFLESVASSSGGWPRLASLVADPRFHSIDWLSLDSLAGIVNQRSGTPIIGNDLYREAWHPFGMGRVENQMDRAMKEYPRETRKLLAVLEQWRQRIRASAPNWGQAGPPWNPPMN